MQFTMRLRHHSLNPKLTVGAICLSELTAPSHPALGRHQKDILVILSMTLDDPTNCG